MHLQGTVLSDAGKSIGCDKSVHMLIGYPGITNLVTQTCYINAGPIIQGNISIERQSLLYKCMCGIEWYFYCRIMVW